MKTDVLIIGGGLAGLSCATALAGSGLAVTLVEKSPALGGRACSCVDDATGDTVDIGPHILLTEYPNMLRLLDRLGTRGHIVWHTDKFITIADRPPVVMHMHRLLAPLHFVPSLLRVPQVSLRDLASNLRVTWFAMKMGAEDERRLDTLDADTFLHHMGVSQRFIDWFWKTASMTLMNVPLERCSAGAIMKLFRQVIGHSDYHVGFPDIALADLFAPGAARVIEQHGGKIVTGAEVQRLLHQEDSATGAVLRGGRRIAARFCIAAVPPQELLAMLPAQWKSRALFRNAADFRPSPYISSYVWFDRKLSGERFWSRVWSPDNLNYDFYDLSNIRRGWAGRPSVIASNLIYSDRIGATSDEDVIEAVLRELGEFLPEVKSAKLRHARVHRIPMGIPAPHPRTEGKRPDVRTPVRNLYLAGDWTNTGIPASMESAVRSGMLAAEVIWERIGRPRSLALEIDETQGLAGCVRKIAACLRHGG